MRRLPSLRLYTIALVTASIVPLAILTFTLINVLDRQHRHASAQSALRMARTLSDAVDRQLNDTVASLETLASSPGLDVRDLRGFYERLAAVAATRRWTSSSLFDASGRTLVSTAQSFGAPSEPLAHREVLQEVTTTRKPVISGDVFGSATAESGIRIGVPVIRRGVVRYVLLANVPPAQTSAVLTAQSIPAGWSLALIDRRQRTVATTLEPDPFVGQSIRQRMAAESARADEGWFPSVNLKGVPTYAVFHRSSRSGLVVVMNVPREFVDQAAHRAQWIAGGCAFVLLVASFVVALVLARRLGASLETVQRAADALVPGRGPATRGSVIIREHQAMVESLDRTAALLRAHQAVLFGTKADAEAARDELAQRVTGLTLLAELSTRLVPRRDLFGPLHDVLDAAIRITGADMGNIQLRDASAGHLEIVAQRGLEAEFLDFFAKARDHQSETCGIAMETGQRVVVENVAEDPMLAGSEARDVLLRTGVRAVQSTPLWSRAGELIGMLSTHYRRVHRPAEIDLRLLDVLGRLAADYIERARSEREIDEATTRLEAADRTKNEFLAMLGHELRNPLGAIAGAVHVLEVGKSPDMVERARAIINRQVQHLSRLVDDLLDVSRVTTGRIALEVTPFDLAERVAGAMKAWRDAGRFQGRQVTSDLSSVWIKADATRIEQLLDNLIGNALKWTQQDDRIGIRVAPDGTDAVLEVADSGAGIPPTLIEKIFDLFVQGDRTLDRAHGGLGIGLTLVKALAQLHGGTVGVRSDGLGKGSAFTVRLPAVSAQSEPTPAAPTALAAAARRRVLLVEDNDDAREMLRVSLILDGHDVCEATDGYAAIRAAADVAPDVILMDIGLPGLDGYEAARRIRAAAGGAKIRLIAITGYGQTEDRERAAAAGFDAHLTKPVAPDRLAAALGDAEGTR